MTEKTFIQQTNGRESFEQGTDAPWASRSRSPQIEHARASHLVTVRANVTRLQRGFHGVSVRMRSHELDFYLRFCSKSPPPLPTSAGLVLSPKGYFNPGSAGV